MEYLSLDMSAHPIHAVRAKQKNGRLEILATVCGPSAKEEEWRWMRSWLKQNQSVFKSSTTAVVWDDPELSVSVHPKASGLPPYSSPSTHKEVDDVLAVSCPVSLLPTPSPLAASLLLTAQISQHKSLALFQNFVPSCGVLHKATTLPLALWFALLRQRPNLSTETVSIFWGHRAGICCAVISKGELLFYRTFPEKKLDPHTISNHMLEGLEHFSFLFPNHEINRFLIGGDLVKYPSLAHWLSDTEKSPCDWVGEESHSGDKNDPLSPYWPCLGALYATAPD